MQGTVHGFGRRVTPRLRPWKTVGGAESVYLVIVLLYIKTCFGDITVDWTGVHVSPPVVPGSPLGCRIGPQYALLVVKGD